jgi:hypothetical protein
MERSPSEIIELDGVITQLEERWGLRAGQQEINGTNPNILRYETTVELLNKLVPLEVTAESINVEQENDTSDPSAYENGGILHQILSQTGGTDATLRRVHSDLSQTRKRRLAEFGEMMNEMFQMAEAASQDADDSRARPPEDDMRRVSRMLEILYYSENVQTGIRHLMHLLSTGSESMRNVPGAVRPVQIFGKRFKHSEERDAKNSTEKLVNAMLRKLSMCGYRRYQNVVMMPVVINGQYTYSWQRRCSIESFVWENINSHVDTENFELAMQARGNVDFCITFLTKCVDQYEFPELRKERRIHAFRNAIYITSVMDENKQFRPWSHVIPFVPGRHAPPAEDAILQRMTAGGKVAACFHDCDFPCTTDENGRVVACAETFEKISTHQRWPEDVKEWFRAACGRMLHPIASTPSLLTLEKWQIFFMLLGVGNSGKSTTIDNVVYNFFDSEDVAYIQNNLEKQYGWSKCKGKYIWLAPEIKGDFAQHCDQAQFQQVVEGGRLASAKKYAVEAIEFDPFDLPGMMGANETIEFHDNGESVSRRRVDFWFGQPIMNVDPTMPEKLAAELGHIMYVCNEAYLRKTREVKSRIWDSLPEYFIELRKENAASTNALEHFLQNARVEFHPDYYMSQSEFQRLYMIHCKDNGLEKKTLRKDYIQGPFQRRQMMHSRCSRLCPIENRKKVLTWVLGVRVMQDDAFEDEET